VALGHKSRHVPDPKSLIDAPPAKPIKQPAYSS
jgi:hypothetical protein